MIDEQRLSKGIAMHTLKFHMENAEVFVPDGSAASDALRRTTHLCIAAHQDDIEIMAAQPIVACFQQPERWFTGVVMTDGRGSPRNGLYASYSDDEMRAARLKEQRKAAVIGEYSALVMLDHSSNAVKGGDKREVVDDLLQLLRASSPETVFTHNLADKHDTHVATALRVIEALREMEPAERPRQLIGCEVWRGLDWMVDEDKVVMELSSHENLQAALLGVFDSQIAGGKRYDLASMGRRRANATYFASHGVDQATGLSFGVDMSILIQDLSLDPVEFTEALIGRFAREVAERIRRLEAAG
jgi:LmbE family N-acetylglucosaminyl deacetylase